MRKTINFFSLTCFVIFLTACGYKEGIVQSSPNSYLKFTGNTRAAFVTVDNGDPFPIHSTSDNGKIIHYQVSPGKHIIIVEKNNNVVLKREVLIGKGMTKEINVK